MDNHLQWPSTTSPHPLINTNPTPVPLLKPPRHTLGSKQTPWWWTGGAKRTRIAPIAATDNDKMVETGGRIFRETRLLRLMRRIWPKILTLKHRINFLTSNRCTERWIWMDRMISSKLRKNILILTRFFSTRPPGRQGEVKFRHDENVMDAYNAKYGGTEYESTPGTQSPVTVPQWRCKDNSRDRIAAHGNAHDLRQKIFASLASNGEEKRDFIHTLATTTTSFIVRLVLIRA